MMPTSRLRAREQIQCLRATALSCAKLASEADIVLCGGVVVPGIKGVKAARVSELCAGNTQLSSLPWFVKRGFLRSARPQCLRKQHSEELTFTGEDMLRHVHELTTTAEGPWPFSTALNPRAVIYSQLTVMTF